MLGLQSSGPELQRAHPRGGGDTNPGHRVAALQVHDVGYRLLRSGRGRASYQAPYTLHLVLLQDGLQAVDVSGRDGNLHHLSW